MRVNVSVYQLQAARRQVSLVEPDVSPIGVMTFQIVSMEYVPVDQFEPADACPRQTHSDFRTKRPYTDNPDTLLREKRVLVTMAGSFRRLINRPKMDEALSIVRFLN